MLDLKNITVSVQNKKILKEFTYSFEKNKVYVVMGPNGSGKSTLAYTLMGNPVYELTLKKKSDGIYFDSVNLHELDVQKRAEAGIFLSFQNPLSLSGITPYQLLQLALSGKVNPLTLRKNIQKIAKQLKIPEELLSRSLNDGASSGEKKKLEVLQAAVLDKPIQIFDEVDTGVDVDALKTIATFLHKNKKGKTYIVITHYNRILKYLKPDKVLVLTDGRLIKTGDAKLAQRIEKRGYQFSSNGKKKVKN